MAPRARASANIPSLHACREERGRTLFRCETIRLLPDQGHFDASVLLAPRRGVVARNRLGLTVSDGLDPSPIKAHSG